ncbi:MAG TPA: hypothetical protein VNZ86_08590, partial [Bacteroidia bacterium]|nr:hypothetical protein [Bacteroidia bacterium]
MPIAISTTIPVLTSLEIFNATDQGLMRVKVTILFHPFSVLEGSYKSIFKALFPEFILAFGG